MSKNRQKDTNKVSAEFTVEKLKRLYAPKEPLRFKLKKTRLVDLDDRLKRIYRIKN